ncbi:MULTISPECIES: hypothetical protein [unclassified Streptomyces]|uniref:hypothetical protein n=1 Tax=unclassified Streptomyces TaxID=2593676 RepID=UPI00093BB4D7|nr:MULTISPECIES: hypothetical protein [unclassified Streptomyces]MBT2380317.1 hypothetical protein [Streptomyces sp. ISL-111]MBT2428622.1 hypothetical protein [Streptomyces sp. ISL-112]MBT2464023.1 hypothetical protein [Streptomyces sp. ISL-63]
MPVPGVNPSNPPSLALSTRVTEQIVSIVGEQNPNDHRDRRCVLRAIFDEYAQEWRAQAG